MLPEALNEQMIVRGATWRVMLVANSDTIDVSAVMLHVRALC